MTHINSRHYIRIAEACDDYLAGLTSLEVTINNLEGLIFALEEITADLRNQFLARWGLLEDLYAASLEQPERKLLETCRDKLLAAVTEIRDAASRRVDSSAGQHGEALE